MENHEVIGRCFPLTWGLHITQSACCGGANLYPPLLCCHSGPVCFSPLQWWTSAWIGPRTCHFPSCSCRAQHTGCFSLCENKVKVTPALLHICSHVSDQGAERWRTSLTQWLLHPQHPPTQGRWECPAARWCLSQRCRCLRPLSTSPLSPLLSLRLFFPEHLMATSQKMQKTVLWAIKLTHLFP